MESEVGTLWLVIATILVLSMQAGFLMLEGGRVRAKNSINVAQKNTTDLIIVWVAYIAIGSWIMFGLSFNTLITADLSNLQSTLTPAHLVFQMAFCSTAATIISGAVAERISFRAYLILTAVVAAVIYPVAGRLVWGNSYDASTWAGLADSGFIDFAGSTVVHSVGGWIALVAVLMIGPRHGRFDEQGRPNTMPAFNAVIALFGVFVLLIGWLGFNGGAISPSDPRLIPVLFNTLTAGVFGGFTGMIIGTWLDKGVFNPSRITSGLLGGLVACTASVDHMTMLAAMLVGAGGGALATYCSHILLHRFKLDDPLDAIATHGVAGIFGTLCVAFVMPVTAISSGSRLTQLGVQSLGIVVIALFTCLATWLTLVVIKKFMPLRVSADAEALGLNYTEHGESIGIARLNTALNNQLEDNTSFASGLSSDVDDEHSELASTVNQLITQYESASEQVRIAQVRFQQFAETASDWLWEADADFTLTFIHASSDTQTRHLSLDKLKGENLLNYLEISAQDLKHIEHHVSQMQDLPVFEAILTPGADCTQNLAVEVRAIACHSQEGKLVGFRGTMADITMRKSAEAKALYLSTHDELTGMPNRRALSADLQSAIDRAKHENTAVVVAAMDLDRFKAVNDAYGHGVGDDLLVQVAARITKTLRSVDVAYRTGGDEFVIIFDGFGIESSTRISKNVATRIIETIREPYDLDGLNVSIGASIGLASYPHDDHRAADLLRMSDLALYAAKDAGKNCAVCFEPLQDSEAERQREIEQDLYKAIDNGQFYLMYQPQVDAVSERIIGYEALIRWTHPEHGEILPSNFIPVAEKLNMMNKIGSYVLDEACRFASSWPVDSEGNAPSMSVNVSPLQFSDPAFLTTVTQTLERHKLRPSRLELEITEDVLIENYTQVTQTLQALRDMGVAIAVDDFGSGQTSLRYINQFPLTTIKIDRSFIQNIGGSEKASEITRTIILLGQKLGINVVAEGVEETDQLDLLRQWKCDQIQGFLFSKPMTEDSVSESLDGQRPVERPVERQDKQSGAA